MNITELLKAKINDNKYLSYMLRPIQKEILNTKEKVFFSTPQNRRQGKSFAILLSVLKHITEEPDIKEILIFDFYMSCGIFENNLKHIAEDNNIELSIRRFNSRFLFVNNTRIEFITYSTEIDTCRGKRLDYIYLDNFGYSFYPIEETLLYNTLVPCLKDNGQIYFINTYENQNELRQMGLLR